MKVPEPRKLPSGTWFIQMRLNGVSVPITASSKRECIKQAELVKAEHRAGKRKIEARTSITVDKAVEQYIAKKKNILSPSTVRGYKTIVRAYFSDIKETPAAGIDWQAQINELSKEHSPKTVSNAWHFMSAVLSEAGIQPPKVTLPLSEKKERPFLSPDEIKKFIPALKGTPAEIPALLALHSLRRSEIVGLDWKDIDLKAKTINIHGSAVLNSENQFVRKSANKTFNSARTIPIMIPALYDALSVCKHKQGQVCTASPNTFYDNVNKVCEAAGLPKVGMHGLRHSFASLAYYLKLSEKETMELGGWSDFGTMRKIYTHLDNKSKEKARKKMSKFFEKC